MKFLLNIALGKSIITVYFFIAMLAAIISAVYFETELTKNIALIFVATLGLFIIISAIVSTTEALESRDWPKIKAKLDWCRVSVSGYSVGNAGATSYEPTIEYSFEVGNQIYQGNQYILGSRSYDEPTVEKIVNKIKSDKDNFTISYNPNDPSINVVKPGVNEVHYVRALVGIAIIAFTVSEFFGWTSYTLV